MKKFSIIALILMTIFTFGCSKKDTSDNMVKLNKVDISAISNQQIKNFLTEASEQEGIYKIETKSNTYIYFNGIKNEIVKNCVGTCHTHGCFVGFSTWLCGVSGQPRLYV